LAFIDDDDDDVAVVVGPAFGRDLAAHAGSSKTTPPRDSERMDRTVRTRTSSARDNCGATSKSADGPWAKWPARWSATPPRAKINATPLPKVNLGIFFFFLLKNAKVGAN
jgi:hypothetical protein